MLVGIIAVENVINAFQQVSMAQAAHIIELRLDFLDEWDLDAIQMLKQSIDKPVIFTLRRESHGGLCRLDETTRLERLEALACLEPDYIDIEMDVPLDFVQGLKAAFPKQKLIRSCHDMKGTPQDLDSLLKSLVHPAFNAFKLVTTANHTIDGMRLMAWAKPHLKQHNNLTIFAMGQDGQFTRMIAPILGSRMSYAVVMKRTQLVDGQMSLDAMDGIYQIKRFTDKTRLYGLLGNPVEHSVGHVVHNGIYRHQGLDAAYIKMRVEPLQLESFFNYAKSLPFQGFSITSPLKTEMLHHMKDTSGDCKQTGSVNTVARERDDFLGFNTDGVGALDAIEARFLVYEKSLLILGAGGAARAIAFEAKRRGANVTCVNRTFSKAKHLATGLGIDALEMDALKNSKHQFNVLINTIPSQLGVIGFMFPKEALKHFEIVLDCNYAPHETALLRQSRLAGVAVVYGIEMYIKQAIAQMDIWFHEKLNREGIEEKFYDLLQLDLKRAAQACSV